MIVFDDNEFEIIIATYNRANFVSKLLDICYDDCSKRNINITVLDSSTNDDTKAVVDDKNKKGWNVKYKKVSSDVIIGYKSVAALLESTCKYVWIMGDSRHQDFNEMDLKVFPLIKDDANFITFYPDKNKKDVYVYDNVNEFLLDHLDSTTCIGTSIFNAELFRQKMMKDEFVADMDEKFAQNYGFAWLGYIFSSLAESSGKIAYVNIDFKNIYSNQKKQTWAKRFYGCWCEDLCDFVFKLPATYKNKNDIIRKVWDNLSLDSLTYLYKGRLFGDVNFKVVHELYEKGYLSICTEKQKRFLIVAQTPKIVVKIILPIHLLVVKMYHLLKKIFF